MPEPRNNYCSEYDLAAGASRVILDRDAKDCKILGVRGGDASREKMQFVKGKRGGSDIYQSDQGAPKKNNPTLDMHGIVRLRPSGQVGRYPGPHTMTKRLACHLV